MKLIKILGGLLLWSGLFSLGGWLAADLPAVRASYTTRSAAGKKGTRIFS